MNAVKSPHNCPVCHSKDLKRFDAQLNLCPAGNFIIDAKDQAVAIAKTAFEFAYCRSCAFVFNAAFDESAIDYAAPYNNMVASKAFDDFLDRRAEFLQKFISKKNAKILEAGCGDGRFLRRLKTHDNICVGIDPAVAKPESTSGFTLTKKFFESSDGAGFDMVVCRHTLEHIPEPLDFIQSLAQGKSDYIYIEIPRFEYLLERQTYYALTYEHCSWYSRYSLAKAFAAHSYVPVFVENLFDEEYLGIVFARPDVAGARDLSSSKEFERNDLETSITDFCAAFQSYFDTLNSNIATWQKSGKVCALWGIAGKGVALLTGIENPQNIAYVVDANPAKHLKYVPITGHQILHPDKFGDLSRPKADVVLITNRIYQKEITTKAHEIFGHGCTIVPV